MNGKTVVLMANLATALALSAEAGCRVDISNYVGWTIIYSGTVTGYIDEHGREGCDSHLAQ